MKVKRLACVSAVALYAWLGISGGSALAYDLPTHLKANLFCPARVASVFPIHTTAAEGQPTDLGTDDQFAIRIEADTPEKIGGAVDLLSGDTVYRLPFQPQVLATGRRDWTLNGMVASTQAVYFSQPMYIELPRKAPLDAVWISDAVVNGAPADCATIPLVQRYVTSVAGLSDSGIIGAPSADEIRAHAPAHGQPVAWVRKLDRSACATIFQEGQMKVGATPVYPEQAKGALGDAIILLAIDAAGHVADESVFLSAGNEALDAAALVAAAHSVFEPPAFLCVPVPGFYRFLARFVRK